MMTIRGLVAAVVLTCLVPVASATVLTFDDLSAEGLVPANYGGLNWSSSTWFAFGAEQAPFTAHSGEYRATVGWDGNENTSGIGFNAPAHFQGAYFAGFEGVQLSFNLYLGGQLVATSSTLEASATPAFLSSGYTGLVDRITLASNEHANFVMDDFTFTAAVPEPHSLSLALAGLAAVGWIARRRISQA